MGLRIECIDSDAAKREDGIGGQRKRGAFIDNPVDTAAKSSLHRHRRAAAVRARATNRYQAGRQPVRRKRASTRLREHARRAYLKAYIDGYSKIGAKWSLAWGIIQLDKELRIKRDWDLKRIAA